MADLFMTMKDKYRTKIYSLARLKRMKKADLLEIIQLNNKSLMDLCEMNQRQANILFEVTQYISTEELQKMAAKVHPPVTLIKIDDVIALFDRYDDYGYLNDDIKIEELVKELNKFERFVL